MLKQRILTALVALAVLAVVLFVLPSVVARTVIALLVLAGAYEWGGFIDPRAARSRYVYVALIGALMAGLFFALPDAGLLDAVFKIALVWWLTALVWMLFFPTPIPVPVIWICGLLVLVPTWVALDHLYMQQPEMLLFLLMIVWVADIGAYFVGKGFGRVKLAPAISPGKTWEGVLGGLSAVLVLAGLGSRYFEIDNAVLVPFCLAIAMLSVVGDLTVSMFKRNAGVKDSGALFPGHGGVLDRIDSVTAAAPLFALGLTWIGSA
jgi:phosphatidate cytidylyltransferase